MRLNGVIFRIMSLQRLFPYTEFTLSIWLIRILFGCPDFIFFKYILLIPVKKTDIALEYGLPYGMASRLKGDTDEDIRKDAQDMMAMMKGATGRKKSPAQSDDTGKGKPDETQAAYAQLLTDLNIGGN